MLTAQQIQERKNYIGGSDVGVILGVNPWKTAKELLAEKRGEVEPPDLSNNADVQAGNILEPINCQLYAQKTGRMIERRNNTFHHPEYHFIAGNVDRVILKDPRGVGILEAKCVRSTTFNKYRREGLPLTYALQLQHYFLATGYKWGSLSIMNRDDLQILEFDVEVDPDLQMKIKHACLHFYDCMMGKAELMEMGIQAEEVKPILDSTIHLITDPQMATAMQELREAKELAETSEELYKQTLAKVGQFIPEGKKGIEGSGVRVQRVITEGKESLDVARLQKAFPDLPYGDFMKKSKSSNYLKVSFVN